MFNINEKGILYTLMDMLSRRISLLSLGKYEENLLLYLYERVACSVHVKNSADAMSSADFAQRVVKVNITSSDFVG